MRKIGVAVRVLLVIVSTGLPIGVQVQGDNSAGVVAVYLRRR
jgi:hypothetical protein